MILNQSVVWSNFAPIRKYQLFLIVLGVFVQSLSLSQDLKGPHKLSLLISRKV